MTGWCRECEAHHPIGRHLPIYRAWQPLAGESEEYAAIIRATDAEEAAEKWAEHDDSSSADYAIVGGRDATVTVRGPDGTLTTWTVSGESVPTYSAVQS